MGGVDGQLIPDILPASFAGVVELVDAPVSKTGEGNLMPVRFRPSAMYLFNPQCPGGTAG